jgi:amidohydrolase
MFTINIGEVSTLTIDTRGDRSRLRERAVALRDEFVGLSQDIHAHPELAFEERCASRRLMDWLERAGFLVTNPIAGLATAFIASAGSGAPHIAYLLEYDALPEIGHACGHNLIAAGGTLAATLLQQALPDHAGTLSVIGTPAEEGGGGKIIELEAGVFDGIDAALMFHPGDRTLPWRHSISSAHLSISFHGQAAHAAKDPQSGRNALAAMIQFFVAVDGLRQHIPEKARIHGVIRHGGAAANVVPDYTEAEMLVRDVTRERALALVERVTGCAEGAALATGTTTTVKQASPVYAERKNNKTIAGRLAMYLESLGVAVEAPSFANPAGSSDMGNVSLVLPAIHPYLQIADRGTPSHSVAFREAASTQRAHDAAWNMAIALAQTGADLLTDPHLLAQARAEFDTHGADIADG